jgi:hypothetical protein
MQPSEYGAGPLDELADADVEKQILEPLPFAELRILEMRGDVLEP